MGTRTWGIDLGTTCSAIGYVADGVPRLIAVDGSPLVPSVVSYTPSGPVVGAAARNRLALEPERTIRSAKRHMGTDHTWTIDGQTITPQDVGAEVLRALCAAAEAATGERPRRVVITVPAWFTQAQRAATREAGRLAGLEVARIINEPTAAALAHAQGQPCQRRALVYDLGGGTFDVSLVDQDGDLVEVRASRGDTRLGGDDVDHALLTWVYRQIPEGLARAIQASPGAQARLLLAVEEARIALSATLETTLRAPFLVEVDGRPEHLELPIRRDAVEEVFEAYLERTLACVDQVLEDAKVDPRSVSELLLVGGLSQTPRVWHALQEHLGLEGSAAIPPDKAVALGAAIQGAIIDGVDVMGILVDVAPYALSVGVSAGPMPSMSTHALCRVLTPRNAVLPSRHTERFQTSHPLQTEISIPVFQGSSKNPLKNVILGEIRMDRLPPAPDGTYARPISVEFRHDLDGLVTIQVTDDWSGRTARGTVVAAGDEDARLRERLHAWMRDLIPGDGTDEDDAPEAAPEDSATAGPWVPEDDEMRQTFEAVLAAQKTLGREHPSDAPELVALASRGLMALGSGAPDAARDPYERLSDQLFALGIYL